MKIFHFIFLFFQKGNCQISANSSNDDTRVAGGGAVAGANVSKCAKPSQFSSVEVGDYLISGQNTVLNVTEVSIPD